MSWRLALVVLTSLCVTEAQAHSGPRLETSGDGAAQYQLQAKINWVDTSRAPLLRIFASVLDGRFKSVNFDDVHTVTVLSDDVEGGKQPLLTFDREQERVMWAERLAAAREADDPPAQLTLAEESPGGLAAVIIANGYDGTVDESAPGYRDSDAGARILGGVGLLLKQLGKANRMNVIWYGDDVKTWVNAVGRQTDLTPFSKAIQASCAATRLKRLSDGETAELAAGEAPGEGEVFCGLTPEVDKLMALFDAGDNLFEGAYPNLFGLDWRDYTTPETPGDYCKEPEVKRRVTRRLRDDEETTTEEQNTPRGPWVEEPSALELGLSMLIRDGKVGQPRALIILSDGKDGYVHRLRECKTQWRNHGECRPLRGKAQRECVNKWLRRDITREQQRFLPKAERWIALAKSAGVRIFTVIHPNAESFERERLEVLAFKTGGTARYAETVAELDGAYADLIDELNGQLVLSFIDDEATPKAYREPEEAEDGQPSAACDRHVDCDSRSCVAGACEHAQRYRLDVEVVFPNKTQRRAKTKEAFATVIAPSSPLSAATLTAKAHSALEAKLGPTGTLALLIGLGVLLGLLLLKWTIGRVMKAREG